MKTNYKYIDLDDALANIGVNMDAMTFIRKLSNILNNADVITCDYGEDCSCMLFYYKMADLLSAYVANHTKQ